VGADRSPSGMPAAGTTAHNGAYGGTALRGYWRGRGEGTRRSGREPVMVVEARAGGPLRPGRNPRLCGPALWSSGERPGALHRACRAADRGASRQARENRSGGPGSWPRRRHAVTGALVTEHELCGAAAGHARGLPNRARGWRRKDSSRQRGEVTRGGGGWWLQCVRPA
jgi:hypothetical protein